MFHVEHICSTFIHQGRLMFHVEHYSLYLTVGQRSSSLPRGTLLHMVEQRSTGCNVPRGTSSADVFVMQRMFHVEHHAGHTLRQGRASTKNTVSPIGETVWITLVGARGFEPPASASRTLRSTRLSHAPCFQLYVLSSPPMVPHIHNTCTARQGI